MALMAHISASTTTLNTSRSSATLDPTSLPPPTYNHLDAAQRSRLIRSTRKLGKLLGTTPCVLETVRPPLPTTGSVTDIASKRCSVPPTPKPTFIDFEFTSTTDSTPNDNDRSRKASLVSDNGSEPCSTHTHTGLNEFSGAGNYIQHRKASSDALGPLPTFSDSESVRHRSKRSQPILRLPPVSPSSASLLPLPSGSHTSSSLFSSDYTLDVMDRATKTPLPLSPTTSASPTITDMPPTPPSGLFDEVENATFTLPEEVLSYPGIQDEKSEESRIRKRRMEKLMRHLGEYVPSELVSGSSPRPRDTLSFSMAVDGPPPSAPPDNGHGFSGLEVGSKMKEAQSRVMRRVSVISGHQRRRPYADESDVTSSGCLSDPEPGNGLGNTARIHAILLRERNKIHIPRKEGRTKEKPLVEDDWTPEAYEDVVKRLRRLK